MLDKLAEYGLPVSKLAMLASVAEDVKEPSKRQVREGKPQLAEGLSTKTAVLLVGNTPLESVTGKKGIKQKRGRPFEQDGNIYLPTMPPGTALYDARTIPMMESDLRLFAEIVRKGEIPREDALDYTIVDCERKFRDMLCDLAGTVSFDIETNGLYPWAEGAKVISIGFGTRERQWCLPLHHHESQWASETHARLFRALDRRLRNCCLVAHNGKFDSLWLRVHYGVDWRADFDTMLAHYMLDENARHGLKLLAQVYFGAPNYDADLDTKQGEGPLDKHCLYLAHDAYYTRKLKVHLSKLLREDPAVERLFERLIMPLASLFVDIEFNGVLVDYDRYEEAEVHLRGELKQAEREIRRELKLHGIDFDKFKRDRRGDWEPLNLGSPQQLAKLFFEDLKLPVLDRTDKGKPSTNESVLLRIDHPVARAMMKWRGADQNLKMFIDGWRGFLVKHADGWRLHPSFKLHGTVTGRASCEHPNLQQVPRESMIRSLIGAPDGWGLLEIDLSQIEMRIAAELSGDETLLGLFDRDEDVHWLTATREIGRAAGMAREVLETARLHTGKKNLSYGDAMKIVYEMGPDRAAELMPVWKELRKKAKAINFGYLFGMWWKKFIIYARDNYGVHVTEKQAQDSRKFFFSTYKRLAPWHDKQRRFAMRNGYVRSLTGGKRRLPDAQLPHDCPARGEAQRQAINSPVQRLACELNYMVLLQLVREFGLDVARPIGTVHDATLIEVKLEWMERVHNRALEIMQKPSMLHEDFKVNMRVPIKGDAKIGNWSKGVSLARWLAGRKSN
jgi:DNA polymerase I-like protein with 3'-5' exonuclease and polymerase domains